MAATLQHHPAGLTWHENDAMARAAHAVTDGTRYWLIDPFEDEAALAAAAQLGEPAGVIQLLDRHNRDNAAIAERLGVAHHRLPKAVPDTPFDVLTVVDRPWWRERALWWPARSTLIVAEAIGTGSYFSLGRRAGVHPFLRMIPPRGALGRYAPDHLLCGHGPAVTDGADRALREALDHSRTDLPRFALQLPGMIRAAI